MLNEEVIVQVVGMFLFISITKYYMSILLDVKGYAILRDSSCWWYVFYLNVLYDMEWILCKHYNKTK